MVFHCVPIMQINTGSPLEHHWVLASANVVPVASQCTCVSSALSMWSVQWYPSVRTQSGLEVIRSGHFPAWPLCIQLVWWELFELNWFHLTCNPKYSKPIMVLISNACTEWCWSTHMCEEQTWYPLQSSKLQVKAEYTVAKGVFTSCCWKWVRWAKLFWQSLSRVTISIGHNLSKLICSWITKMLCAAGVLSWQFRFHDLQAIFSLSKVACWELSRNRFFKLRDWLILGAFGISWDHPCYKRGKWRSLRFWSAVYLNSPDPCSRVQLLLRLTTLPSCCLALRSGPEQERQAV